MQKTELVAEMNKDAVETRAYRLYVERGRADGTDVDDWFEAERQLTEEVNLGSREARPTRAARSKKAE